MESGSVFNEEDYISKGKLAFSYSSSSSPSSSSSQQKGRLLSIPPLYDKHRMGYWLGNKYDPDEDNETVTTTTTTTTTKAELMDVTTDEEDGKIISKSSVVVIEKEHMFDKVVTPSDVGKLNRLVIPKQHAEKYFPLDSSTNEKGLLLNFQDRNGKEWRFRYSYWNSSQSYVMTKGWSRFVKEKKLDAGDIVSFQRGVGELGRDRLYIDWRRRPDVPPDPTSHHHHHHHHHYSSVRWSPLLMRPPAVPLLSRDHLHLSNPNRNAYYTSPAGASYGFGYSTNYSNVVNPCSSSGSVFYLRSASAAAAATAAPQQSGMGMVQWQQGESGVLEPTMVYESVPVVQGKAAAKRLRLFGVNMDCPIASEANHVECNKLSSTTTMPTHGTIALQHPQISSQPQLPLQLRLYNGTPLQAIPSTQFLHKQKPSMSLDLDV